MSQEAGVQLSSHIADNALPQHENRLLLAISAHGSYGEQEAKDDEQKQEPEMDKGGDEGDEDEVDEYDDDVIVNFVKSRTPSLPPCEDPFYSCEN